MSGPTLVQGSLSKDEEHLLGLFRSMDTRRRGEALAFAKIQSQSFPAGGARRRLRLVAAFGEVTA